MLVLQEDSYEGLSVDILLRLASTPLKSARIPPWGVRLQTHEGNKSGRPRVLPLDAEVQKLLTRYLISQPDVAADWVFLSKEKHGQLGHQDITSIWKSAFHPMYTETEHSRAVTSHFGRHFFTTYWRIERELPRPLIKYMRGDSPGNESIQDKAGIDHYIHTYYEDIEPLFREGRIFNFNV